jgi:hypothetical protein
MIASLNFVRDLLNRKPIYDRMLAFFAGENRQEGLQ